MEIAVLESYNLANIQEWVKTWIASRPNVNVVNVSVTVNYVNAYLYVACILYKLQDIPY